jgi:hypothetical protein
MSFWPGLLSIMERTFPSMGEGADDRVHSGGIPTTTVLRTVLSATVERARSRSTKVQAWSVPSRAIKEKVKDGRALHLVLFGL